MEKKNEKHKRSVCTQTDMCVFELAQPFLKLAEQYNNLFWRNIYPCSIEARGVKLSKEIFARLPIFKGDSKPEPKGYFDMNAVGQ